MVEIGA